MALPLEQLQRIYDQVLSQVEAATPPQLMTPAARAWLRAMRRRRWAMTEMQTAAPGSASSSSAAAGPPPPPPPPPGDDPADGGDDVPVGPPLVTGGTDEALPAEPGGGEPGDGTDAPVDTGSAAYYRALVVTVHAPPEDPFGAAAVAAAVAGVVASAPVAAAAPITLAFGSGTLANYWQAYKETWTQTDGIISAATNATGHGVLANTSVSPTAFYNVNMKRPNGGNNNCGPAACLSINAAGQVSGYAAISDGVNVTLYRIDADVWTALAAGAFGAWLPGALFTLQYNGGTLKAFNNGVQKAVAADATYTTGFAGLASAAVGNFTAEWSIA